MHQPDLYSSVSDVGGRQTKDFLNEFSEEIRRMSGRCLDIGSGPGDVTFNTILPKLNPNATIVASNISESMVNHGKESYKDNDRISFMQLDIQTPNLPNDLIEQFDNVTSFYCLHWCNDLRKAFENIFDLLRPGGFGFFAFLAEFPSFAATEALASMQRYQPYMQDLERFTPFFRHEKRPRESLKRLLKDVGFQVHHCSCRVGTAVYRSREDLKETEFHIMHKPDLYSSSSKMVCRQTNDLLYEFSEEIRRMSGRCLDIGTGPGDVAVDVLLPKLSPKATIVGSDISENMVDYGKKKYKDNDRVSFMNLDIGMPNLPNDLIGQFDNVTSFYCLHWCHDMRKVFENIFSLLRPGGSTFLTFLADYPTFASTEVLANMRRYQPYMQDVAQVIPVFHYEKRPRETLKALLKDVGFQVHHCSCREMASVFKTREDLSEFMLTINPYRERIPPEMLEDYKEDLAREVMKRTFISNQNSIYGSSILFTFQLLVVYLTKPLQAK